MGNVIANLMKSTGVILMLSLITILAGCQSQQPVAQVTGMPDWILNPGNGSVGSSVIHVRGRHYQEQLAVTRARQELAARQGVDVEYVQLSSEVVTNKTSNSSVSRSGKEEVTTKTVKAKVTQKWVDPSTREIFVLLMP